MLLVTPKIFNILIVLITFMLAMVKVWTFLHLVPFLYVILPAQLVFLIIITYSLFHLSPKISLVFVNLLLIMVFILNFFLTIVLSNHRTTMKSFSKMFPVLMAYITSLIFKFTIVLPLSHPIFPPLCWCCVFCNYSISLEVSHFMAF